MDTLIAESVSYLHPDKLCDQISDAILDAFLAKDPKARVAVETAGGHGHVSLFGEITSTAEIDVSHIAQKTYHTLTGNDIAVHSYVTKQSPEIAQGVDTGGAGDQGIMVGYACTENDQYIPQEMYLSRKLLEAFNADAKSQVVLNNKTVLSVVLSVQGKTQKELLDHIRKTIDYDKNTTLYANNTGAFTIGGFDADSGCTGRKIVVDAYGPRVPVGGGAFSGKDPTKVDRSAAYMARWIALQILKTKGAREVLVRLGYVIGAAQPLIRQAFVDGTETTFDYDCRPKAIIEQFSLQRPIYQETARYGHFGRIGAYPWEEIA